MDRGNTPTAREIELRAEPASPAQARDFTRRTLAEWGYHDVQDEVALMVTELVTNAVVHAQSPSTVTLMDMEGKVRVRVRDGDASPPKVVLADETATGGRGIFLVDALSDEWGVISTPPGKVVWLDISGH